MISLLGKENCPICDQSKKLLDDNNIEYNFIDLMMPENLSLVKKFNIKVAGKYIYDSDTDTVIEIHEYVNKVSANNG